MKKNKQAMSIVLAMVLTILMWLIAIYIIDYIIPFSKNVKDIENVSRAYYQAQGWVERSLLFVKDNFWTNSWKTFSSTSIDYQGEITALGNLLPPEELWNSEFDNNYNRLRFWEPIQLEIWKGYLVKDNWNDIKFTIRVPDLNWDWNFLETLSGSDSYIINWQLISQSSMLNASGSQITASDINVGLKTGKNIFDWTESNSLVNSYGEGFDLYDNLDNFKNFYWNNCEWSNSGCTLKMSIINKLELDTNNTPIPYLEWKIDLSGTSKNIPLRYTQIHSEWKSYWFKKEINVRVPQQTVNEAFDFTVFQ